MEQRRSWPAGLPAHSYVGSTKPEAPPSLPRFLTLQQFLLYCMYRAEKEFYLYFCSAFLHPDFRTRARAPVEKLLM